MAKKETNNLIWLILAVSILSLAVSGYALYELKFATEATTGTEAPSNDCPDKVDCWKGAIYAGQITGVATCWEGGLACRPCDTSKSLKHWDDMCNNKFSGCRGECHAAFPII